MDKLSYSPFGTALPHDCLKMEIEEKGRTIKQISEKEHIGRHLNRGKERKEVKRGKKKRYRGENDLGQNRVAF